MCTVSWRGRPNGGYDLFFNRDESRKRSRALAPRIHVTEGGLRYISATDPDAGGTWLATNDHGITVGLLNFYDASPHSEPSKPTSRGLLVRSLAGAVSLAEITVPDPSTYRPFYLFAVDLAADSILFRWDGEHLTLSTCPGLPLTTSSYKTPEVLAYRKQQFELTPSLEAYHRHHNPALPKHSPLMVRTDSITHSISHLTVTATKTTYRYFDPPTTTTPHSTTLE